MCFVVGSAPVQQHSAVLSPAVTYLLVAAVSAWSSRSLAMFTLRQWSSDVTTSVLSLHSASSSSCRSASNRDGVAAVCQAQHLHNDSSRKHRSVQQIMTSLTCGQPNRASHLPLQPSIEPGRHLPTSGNLSFATIMWT